MGYKIKDLEKLSGIKAHTIRIWEKRYNMFTPERTESKVRSYSDAELVHLLNVCILYNNGYKISHIALMDKEAMYNAVAKEMVGAPTDSSAEKLLKALVDLDEELFSATLNALIDKQGMIVTFSDYLIPFLKRIGVMWLVGTVRPCQEHFMSSIIRQKLIASFDKLPVPSMNKKAVLLFLPENEWHELGLLFYNYTLRENGQRTVYLGQSMPYKALVKCITDLKPKAVVTSWLTISDSKRISHYFKKLKKDIGQVPIYVGGSQISSNKEALSGCVEIKDLSDLTNI